MLLFEQCKHAEKVIPFLPKPETGDVPPGYEKATRWAVQGSPRPFLRAMCEDNLHIHIALKVLDDGKTVTREVERKVGDPAQEPP